MRTAFDTETWLIAPGRLAPRLVCLTTSAGAILNAAEAVRWMRCQLQAGAELIGHNVAFDLGVLVQADPTLMPLVFDALDNDRIHDTMLLEQLIKIAEGRSKFDHRQGGKPPSYTLAALAAEHLGVDVQGKGPDAWRFRYRELDGLPFDQWPRAAVDYAKFDAELTARVFKEQLAACGGDLPPTYHDQIRAAWALHLMSAWGMRTDPASVAALRAVLEGRLYSKRAMLIEAGVLRADGTKDTKAIKARVVAALGDATPRTDKSNVKTSEAVLRMTADPALLALADTLVDQKELSTYLPILEQGTTRPVNARYRVCVDTSRTACSRPNMQNQPRRSGVRECWAPRDGWVYISADYHVAELCALGQLCLHLFGHSRLAEDIRAGLDPHLAVGAQLLGISYAEAAERRGDPDVKKARQTAKALNFGAPGGLGAATFQAFAAGYGVDIDEDGARDLLEVWKETYPEMALYFTWIGEQTQRGRFTYYHPITGFIRGDVGFCDGCNMGFQHLVAQGAKAALYEVQRECWTSTGALAGCRPVVFIHDEIIMEAPEAIASEAAARLSDVMVRELAKLIPDVPIQADAAMMRRWHKGAEPLHDEQGRLIPWEPKR